MIEEVFEYPRSAIHIKNKEYEKLQAELSELREKCADYEKALEKYADNVEWLKAGYGGMFNSEEDAYKLIEERFLAKHKTKPDESKE